MRRQPSQFCLHCQHSVANTLNYGIMFALVEQLLQYLTQRDTDNSPPATKPKHQHKRSCSICNTTDTATSVQALSRESIAIAPIV